MINFCVFIVVFQQTDLNFCVFFYCHRLRNIVNKFLSCWSIFIQFETHWFNKKKKQEFNCVKSENELDLMLDVVREEVEKIFWTIFILTFHPHVIHFFGIICWTHAFQFYFSIKIWKFLFYCRQHFFFLFLVKFKIVTCTAKNWFFIKFIYFFLVTNLKMRLKIIFVVNFFPSSIPAAHTWQW